jgi:hypothetical protein
MICQAWILPAPRASPTGYHTGPQCVISYQVGAIPHTKFSNVMYSAQAVQFKDIREEALRLSDEVRGCPLRLRTLLFLLCGGLCEGCVRAADPLSAGLGTIMQTPCNDKDGV